MESLFVRTGKESVDPASDGGTSDPGLPPAAPGLAGESGDKGEPMLAVSTSHPWVHVAIATGLLLPLQAATQSIPAQRNASAGFAVSITVRPQFRILESRPVGGGHEYRVWTNMKAVELNGREYRFERIGESTVVVPGALIEMPAQDAPAAASPAPQGG